MRLYRLPTGHATPSEELFLLRPQPFYLLEGPVADVAACPDPGRYGGLVVVDLLLGLAFVAMIVAPVVAASLRTGRLGEKDR